MDAQVWCEKARKESYGEKSQEITFTLFDKTLLLIGSIDSNFVEKNPSERLGKTSSKVSKNLGSKQ